ncbi:ABC transporter ATP-binding protein [Rhodovastum sp. RN2-1]|uniref:ABC transporter ATP-binding protein n=1 Tax=Limobrevibacterium gyesilva TaxID=2991712 RepID=A0AA42CCC4_9PROT|nr:ABC transporter ATP-binding protein [Limobrevibacterium gyesilva]MCW3473088.1 ABC transporter ATP-binding protein [Limobrevibacterium gyesilva]
MPTSPLAEIDVSALSLDFPLYHASGRSLKKTVLSTVAGRMGADAKRRIVVQALRDISFTLRSGDRLGLIGTNGAGKTTLLRTLAGIYEPLNGSVRVQGTLNALLDPHLGMNVNLTGRENITLRGMYHGLGPAAVKRLLDDVRDFAELGNFMELPVRIYSAGMIVRLGFALATAIRPQVLLMDEWFLAGDANFMEKARARLEDMVRGAEILVLSTHSTETLMDWCNRLIWMEQGRIREDGPTEQVLEHYLGHPLKQKAVPASLSD